MTKSTLRNWALLATLTACLGASSTPAFAFGRKRPKPTPQATAEPVKNPNNPMRRLDLNEDEIRELLAGIESQGVIGPSEINIDSLRHPGDKVAYEKAIELLSARVLGSVQSLAAMKRDIIRYSVIVNQADLNEEKVATITETSSKISQGHYDKALGTLVDSYSDEVEALKLCISEVCVIEISQAFEDLTAFAQSANQDLDFRRLNDDRRVFWNFQSPVLRVSFARMFKKLVPDNKDHNLFKVAAAGIVTPLSVVGVTSVEMLRAAGSAIFNPRYRHIKLDVKHVSIDFKAKNKDHRGLFRSQYAEAATGARAASYRALEPVKPQVDPGKPTQPAQPALDPNHPVVNSALAAINRESRALLSDKVKDQVDADLNALIFSPLSQEANRGYYDRNTIYVTPEIIGKVESLLQSGASPNVGLKTTLSRPGDNESMKKLLGLFINYGGDPMITLGTTSALEMAVAQGRSEWIAMFADNVNVQTRLTNERTVLMIIAPMVNTEEVLAKLIARGADVNARDKDGNSVLFYARLQPANRAVLVKAGAQL